MSSQLTQLQQKDLPKFRKKLIKRQKGICPICKQKIDNPCVDHSHTKRIKGSGQIRGVVCRACNVFLAKVENNCVRYSIQQDTLPQILRNIAEYLEQEHLPIIHPTEAPKALKLKKSSYNALKKQYDGQAKFPDYPKSKKLTKPLEKLFKKYQIEPEYYKK